MRVSGGRVRHVRVRPVRRAAVLTVASLVAALIAVLSSGSAVGARPNLARDSSATTTVSFSFNVTDHQVVRQTESRMTTFGGSGTVTGAPLPPEPGDNRSATGTAHFTRSLFSAHGVLLTVSDRLTLRVTRAYEYVPMIGGKRPGFLGLDVVVVHSADEKNCAKGSEGHLVLSDGSPVGKPDWVELHVCNVHGLFTAGVGGAHVVVTIHLAGDSIAVSSSNGGLSTYYFAGPNKATTICTAGATLVTSTGFGGDCQIDQAVGGKPALITAKIGQPVPSGQQLVIIYDSGNGADPEFMNCLSVQPAPALGCVIKATKTQSTSVRIPIPAHKSDYGGVHYLDVIAELYPATTPAAELDLRLCEAGQSPVCG